MGSLFYFMDNVKNNRAVYRLPDGGTTPSVILVCAGCKLHSCSCSSNSPHIIIAVAQSFTIVFCPQKYSAKDAAKLLRINFLGTIYPKNKNLNAAYRSRV